MKYFISPILIFLIVSATALHSNADGIRIYNPSKGDSVQVVAKNGVPLLKLDYLSPDVPECRTGLSPYQYEKPSEKSVLKVSTSANLSGTGFFLWYSRECLEAARKFQTVKGRRVNQVLNIKTEFLDNYSNGEEVLAKFLRGDMIIGVGMQVSQEFEVTFNVEDMKNEKVLLDDSLFEKKR